MTLSWNQFPLKFWLELLNRQEIHWPTLTHIDPHWPTLTHIHPLVPGTLYWKIWKLFGFASPFAVQLFWSRCSDKWDQCKRLEPQIRKFCARLQMFWEGFFISSALLFTNIYYEIKSHGSRQHKTKRQYLFWLVCILPGLCRNLRNQAMLLKAEKNKWWLYLIWWCRQIRPDSFTLVARTLTLRSNLSNSTILSHTTHTTHQNIEV